MRNADQNQGATSDYATEGSESAKPELRAHRTASAETSRALWPISRRRALVTLLGVAGFGSASGTAGVGKGAEKTSVSTFQSRTRPTGAIQWNRLYAHGGPHERLTQWVYDLVRTQDGGYAFVGETERVRNEQAVDIGDFWVVKTDANGEEQWSRRFGDPRTWQSAKTLVQLPGGDFVVAGVSTNPTTGVDHTRVLRLDGTGSPRWRRTYRLNGRSNEITLITPRRCRGRAVGLRLAGTTSRRDAEFAYVVIRTRPDGTPTGRRSVQFGDLATKPHILNSVTPTRDGGFLFLGSVETDSAGSFPEHEFLSPTDLWVVKTDADGNEEWEHRFDFGYSDLAVTVRYRPNVEGIPSGYAIVGNTYYPDPNEDDNLLFSGSWLLLTDASGKLHHHKFFEYALTDVSWKPDGYVLASAASRIIRLNEDYDIDYRLDVPNVNDQYAPTPRVLVPTPDGYVVGGSAQFGSCDENRCFSDIDGWLAKVTE